MTTLTSISSLFLEEEVICFTTQMVYDQLFPKEAFVSKPFDYPTLPIEHMILRKGSEEIKEFRAFFGTNYFQKYSLVNEVATGRMIDMNYEFEKLHNFRDLGGLVGDEGRKVLPHQVVEIGNFGKVK